MIGELVPLVLVPRFTSFMAPGTYITVPLEVSEYATARIQIWLGPLAFDPGSGQASQRPHVTVTIEEAFEAQLADSAWVSLWSGGTPGASSFATLTLARRYLRVKVVLQAKTNPSDDNLAAITAWIAGSLERRIPGAESNE